MRLTPALCRELRTARGWGIGQVARAARVAHRTVERIEAGREVHPSAVARVAAALGVGC